VLATALSVICGSLDSKFLTAYWLPAFAAVFGGFGVLVVIVGGEQIDDWIYNLDSVEQTLAVLLLVLLVSMLAFVLRAISRPMIEIFAGDALPRVVADWSTRGQLRVKRRLEQRSEAKPAAAASVLSPQQMAAWLRRDFPLDDAETQPTLFGNVLAIAAEHPRLAYAMEGLLWWPRLSPVVPVDFQDQLAGAQAPMMSLLNLSLVFTLLALGGAVTLVLAGGHWVAAIVTLLLCLLLARLCYRAAVSQASELASLLSVSFDLYRHEVLRQMDLDVPTDLEAERELWRQLTVQLVGVSRQAPAAAPSPEQPEPVAQ
jgi:hypothetical protein